MAQYKTNSYYIFDLDWISIHKKVLGIWVLIYEKRYCDSNIAYVNQRCKYLESKGDFVFRNH